MSRELRFDTLPSLTRLYLKAALHRRDRPRPDTERPDYSAVASGVGVDGDNLDAYRRVCAIVDDGFLPATYPQVLATPLHAAIVADPGFALPAMGMVHLENHIEQHRPIAEGEHFDLKCALSGWEWDERLGMRFAIETTVSVGGELVWRSELWALSRGAPETLVKRSKDRPQRGPAGESPDAVLSVVTDAPSDLGRRYAAICRDYNPIHLHGLTARPFGFRQPIIHGMWTLARCWSELSDHIPRRGLSLSVSFKQPLYLPSKLWISAQSSGSNALSYRCGSPSGDRLYLRGEAAEIDSRT